MLLSVMTMRTAALQKSVRGTKWSNKSIGCYVFTVNGRQIVTDAGDIAVGKLVGDQQCSFIILS